MYYLYILLCNKAFFYTGITSDLNRRIKEHQNGYSSHTKRYKEVELVYSERFVNRYQAELRENQLKGWSVRKKKALITGDFISLKKLSKSKS